MQAERCPRRLRKAARRAETVELWRARRASKRAERRRRTLDRTLERIGARAEVELQKAVDARDLSRR